ncbi:MAG: response regulator [Fibrobacterota bacterium]
MSHSLEATYNPDSDIFAEFHTILIIDDDEMLLSLLTQSILQNHTETVVVNTSQPRLAMEALRHLYFDVLISDINMPALMGDKIISEAKACSPITYTIAITGRIDTAFMAGKCQPDAFLDKNKGFNTVSNVIETGIEESKKRRANILKNHADNDEPAKKHWRDFERLRNELGNTQTDVINSRKKIKAIAFMQRRPWKLQKEQIATYSGYSSYQKLTSAVETVAAIFSI